MSVPRRPFASFVCLLSVLALGGCGKAGTLTGKVTYNGQPVARATVSFLAEGGKTSVTVKCDDQGVYTAVVPLGTARVGVHNVDQAAPDMMMMRMMSQATQQAGEKNAKGEIEKSVQSMQKQVGSARGSGVAIPARYNAPEKSGLEVEIKGGRQTFDIPLAD
jgi:hypothetical protein